MEGGEQEVKKKGRRIVVAMDASEESLNALQWALSNLSLRPKLDALVLLHAKSVPTSRAWHPEIYHNPFAGDTGYIPRTDLLASMEVVQDSEIDTFMNRKLEIFKQEIDAIMNRALKLCEQKEVAVETQAVFGDPRDVICEVVEKLNADFLVIGSHGYGAIKRVMLGSVSDYCAHRVKCPIIIVKKPQDHQKQ